MKINRRKLFVINATITLLMLLAVRNVAAPQKLTSLLTTAQGQGTLTVGQEVFKVSAVVVKLKEDGTGEITVVTDLQLFVTCTWSSTDDLTKGIELKFTGGAAGGGAQGSGKLFLKPDGKSIATLSIQGTSSAAKRKIELEFVAE
jgi:hypothetical protein